MGHESVARELLKRAPEQGIHEYVNLPCNPGTPLYSAALRGHIPIMEQLVEKGAVINLVGGPFGSPLMVACANGQFEAVTWLLKKGAEIQCTKLDGTIVTAEEAAQQHESVSSLLRRFKEHGAEALDEEVPVRTADISKLDEFMIEYKERKQKEAKEGDAKDNWKDKREKGEARDGIGRESGSSGSDSDYSGSES
jgi:ankyrin repeat protein